jgi:hypothetical protein
MKAFLKQPLLMPDPLLPPSSAGTPTEKMKGLAPGKREKSIHREDSEKPMVQNMHIFLYSSEKMTKSLSLSYPFLNSFFHP